MYKRKEDFTVNVLRVYITPEDIVSRLSDSDKKRFNRCVFTDVKREDDGSITLCCAVFNDSDQYTQNQHRQKFFNGSAISIDD